MTNSATLLRQFIGSSKTLGLNSKSEQLATPTVIVLHLPEDARWNAERQAVELGIEIGEYRGEVVGHFDCNSRAAGVARVGRAYRSCATGVSCTQWRRSSHIWNFMGVCCAALVPTAF